MFGSNTANSSRGGNGSDEDQIVLSTYPFSYFQNEYDANMDIIEYECPTDVTRIRIQIEYFINTEQVRTIK
jgi:hypothetical protein